MSLFQKVQGVAKSCYRKPVSMQGQHVLEAGEIAPWKARVGGTRAETGGLKGSDVK